MLAPSRNPNSQQRSMLVMSVRLVARIARYLRILMLSMIFFCAMHAVGKLLELWFMPALFAGGRNDDNPMLQASNDSFGRTTLMTINTDRLELGEDSWSVCVSQRLRC